MKRKLTLGLCLLMVAVMLSACSGQPGGEVFPEFTQNLGPATTVAPTDTPAPDIDTGGGSGGSASDPSIFSANPYDVLPEDGFSDVDPLQEEDIIDPNESDDLSSSLYYNDPNATVYPYAGSSPIPLDPLDMPTPTPRPSLNFTYAAYTASTVGVTFEAPVGWQVDESQAQTLILSEPEIQMKDGQRCIVTFTAEPVTANYALADLRTHVTQRLDMIGGSSFTDWSPSYTATRYVMGSEGVYANYSGTLTDGTKVGGRIHYVCIDRVLYGIEIVYPLGFRGDFIDVFTHIRETIKRIQS